MACLGGLLLFLAACGDDGATDGGRDAGRDAGGTDASPDAAGGADGGRDAGEMLPLVTVQTVAAGNGHTCAIDSTGGVRCWGRNDKGQLGDGTMDDRTMPAPVPGLSGVVAITAGHSHTCAVLDSGAARCWGDNGSGQLGNGLATMSDATPQAVVGLTNVVEVQSFWVHTCARLADSTVHCFGANEGRLGNGLMETQRVPVPMMGVTDAVDIGAGWGHSCAALASGGVRCTGTYNNWGQIGDGTTETRLRPVDVVDLDDAAGLGLGSYHSCVITAGNTVRCWGNNQGGSVGIGTTGDMPYPEPHDVPGLTDVVQVSAGSLTTCALHADRTLHCWGAPSGDGTDEVRSSPVLVPDVEDAIEVEVGTDHACIVHEDRHLSCWGWNAHGQLGAPTPTDYALSPIRVTASPF